MERLKLGVAIVLAVSAGLLVYGARAQSDGKSQKRSDRQYREWRMFGGGPDNIHYSTLDQISRDNVHRLEVAWRFDSGDEFPGSEMQCNPIVVDGVMYMEKYFEELRELSERVLEQTMCDLCGEEMPDDQMNYDPQVGDGAPVCDDCYRKLTADS